MNRIGKDIDKAAALLQAGQCVAIPTETVYGLAANAFDTKAVADIFRIKNRPSFDPLIVHCDSLDKVKALVREMPEWALKLAQHFWPGPLTLVLPKSEQVSYAVSSGLDTVGVRIPNHPLTLELLARLSFPLAAPSANPFGYVSPTTAQHVAESLPLQPEYILDGGPCQKGIESTIIGSENGKACLYRLGSLSLEDIENLIGKVEIKLNASSNPQAPGQLKIHYAPKVPLLEMDIEEAKKIYPLDKIGQIAFRNGDKEIKEKHRCILSGQGDLYEAARNLFSALRALDNMDIEVAIFQYVENIGVGKAINDRLKRASVARNNKKSGTE